MDGLILDVNKQMTKIGPRKIETLIIHIFPPSNLTDNQLKVLKKETRNCPVLRNIEGSIKINLIWKH